MLAPRDGLNLRLLARALRTANDGDPGGVARLMCEHKTLSVPDVRLNWYRSWRSQSIS